jgi:hypothetical protein
MSHGECLFTPLALAEAWLCGFAEIRTPINGDFASLPYLTTDSGPPVPGFRCFVGRRYRHVPLPL